MANSSSAVKAWGRCVQPPRRHRPGAATLARAGRDAARTMRSISAAERMPARIAVALMTFAAPFCCPWWRCHDLRRTPNFPYAADVKAAAACDPPPWSRRGRRRSAGGSHDPPTMWSPRLGPCLCTCFTTIEPDDSVVVLHW